MPTDRRQFLTTLSAAPLAALWAQNGADAAPADFPRATTPTEADLGSLYPEIARLAAGNDYPLSFRHDRFASHAEFQQAGRQHVFNAFAYRPEPVAPEAEIVDREDCGEFVREKLLFSTAPGMRVPAYVHVPKDLDGPAPGIIDLHSHGGMFLFGKEKVIDFGDNHPVMTEYHRRNYGGRPTTTALVRRGYVVITIDALMFGERRVMMDDDLQHGWDRSQYSLEVADQLNRRCRSKESTIAKSLTYAGMTWPGVITWDDIRTVDYLVTRPEVDPQRIGCLGVSLGGWRTLFLSALDDRIQAACVVGFLSTVKTMLRRHIDTHSFAHFIPGLHAALDLPDVAALRAPLPLLVQQCGQDQLFPPEGMRAAVDQIAAAYTKAGAAERFEGSFYDGPHRFDVRMQDDAFAWLDRQLKAGGV